ncbi:hypothetical protein ACLB2K_026489 [Fragaria x ananassa]
MGWVHAEINDGAAEARSGLGLGWSSIRAGSWLGKGAACRRLFCRVRCAGVSGGGWCAHCWGRIFYIFLDILYVCVDLMPIGYVLALPRPPPPPPPSFPDCRFLAVRCAIFFSSDQASKFLRYGSQVCLTGSQDHKLTTLLGEGVDRGSPP